MTNASFALSGKRLSQPSVWREALHLATFVPGHRWVFPLLIGLGVAAAIAETLGISLAVLFLFSILGKTDSLAQVGGPFASLLQRLQSEAGADPSMIAGALVVLILCNAGLLYLNEVTSASMANHVAQRVRDLVHERYVTVSYRWLQEQEQGELIDTLSKETWIVADAFNSVAGTAVNLCAVLVFGAGLLVLSWQITLTAAVAAFATFGIMRALARPVRRLGEETLVENQILAERMLVSLHGMRTLRAFAQETYVLRLFAAASSEVRRLANRTERLKALVRPVGEAGSLGALVLIAVVAGWAGVDVPTIVASALLLFRLQPNLRAIDTNRLALDRMTAALRNVRVMLQSEDKIWPTEGTQIFNGLEREIRFEGVTFVHDERRAPSLDSASFVIRLGEVTALAGPSGSGKSTVINLLLRLYEPRQGRILVDGCNLLTLRRDSWLARIAIAGQDVELVEGTVAQNIRLARHDATLEEIREACSIVEILNDIEAIPEGLDARIGPGGLSFSGGQRQRIGIARALIRRPEILILDEAMSALEPALEERIRARIFHMMEGKTVLTVSHRANSLRSADAVVQMSGGKVLSAQIQEGASEAS